MNAVDAVLSLFLLLAANAFFVAAEFSLVASRRHRLEQAAATGGRAARAALRSNRELSLMLAGAQLGGTACTLGLGALIERSVAVVLDPALRGLGLADGVSVGVALALALVLVVFLHVVFGEMAPKSWTIAQPERAAVLLAVPFRAVVRLARPALRLLDASANHVLRRLGVRTREILAQAHRSDELRILLRESRERGLLAERQHVLLSGILRLQETTLADVMRLRESLVTVPADATAAEIEETARRHRELRFLIPVDDEGVPQGVVAVRDAVLSAALGWTARASDLMITPMTLPAALPVPRAVLAMRRNFATLAFTENDDAVVGLVTVADLVDHILVDLAEPPGPHT